MVWGRGCEGYKDERASLEKPVDDAKLKFDSNEYSKNGTIIAARP